MLTYITSFFITEGGFIGVTWYLFAVLIGSAIYWAWPFIRPRYLSLNIPPFPAPRKFLLGHLTLWTAPGKDEVEKATDIREKAGDLVSLDLAGNLMIVVSGYKNIKEVLVKRCAEAPDRPKRAALLHILDEDNHGLLDAGGKVWKEQRATSLMILREFGMGKNIIAEKIHEEVAVFTDKLAALKGEPHDIRYLSYISASNVICSIIVGKRFDHHDPDFVSLMDNMEYMFTKAPTLALMQVMPWLRYFPGDLFGMKSWVQSVLDINENFSKAHITKVKNSRIAERGEKQESFITAYLQKIKEEDKKGCPHELDEKNLVAIIRNLFVAGTETTSTTIYWCVLLCIHHPHVQDKVFAEISATVGQHRPPTMSDRPNLRYLDAVIRETQRYASLASLVARKAYTDFELSGYTVPKDSMLLINFNSIMQDRKTWGDPDKFRPERFLDADGNLVSPEEFIPFGIGRRVCLGEALAKVELFLFLSAMFQRFRFEPEQRSGELPPLKGCFSLVLKPQRFKARFVSRMQQ